MNAVLGICTGGDKRVVPKIKINVGGRGGVGGWGAKASPALPPHLLLKINPKTRAYHTKISSNCKYRVFSIAYLLHSCQLFRNHAWHIQ
jgi:hypothetical protein